MKEEEKIKFAIDQVMKMYHHHMIRVQKIKVQMGIDLARSVTSKYREFHKKSPAIHEGKKIRDENKPANWQEFRRWFLGIPKGKHSIENFRIYDLVCLHRWDKDEVKKAIKDWEVNRTLFPEKKNPKWIVTQYHRDGIVYKIGEFQSREQAVEFAQSRGNKWDGGCFLSGSGDKVTPRKVQKTSRRKFQERITITEEI